MLHYFGAYLASLNTYGAPPQGGLYSAHTNVTGHTMHNKLIDEISQKLGKAMPPGAQVLKEDLEKNFRGVLHASLSKLDLVTREEFEVQSQVLARSRARVEQLEKRLAVLEAQLLHGYKPAP